LITSLLLAGICAALFHLVWGETVIELLRFTGIAVVGFLVGEALARVFDMGGIMLGDVHLLQGGLAACAALVIARWRGATKT
jgi:hypothetical protein